MKKIALFLVAALLIVGVVLSAGCTSTDPIVGQWKLDLGILGNVTVMFYNDGTSYSIGNTLEQPWASEMKWVKNDGTYVLTNLNNKELSYWEMSKDGKTLTISNDKAPIPLTLTKISNTTPAEKPTVTPTEVSNDVNSQKATYGYPVVVDFTMKVNNEVLFSGRMPFTAGEIVSYTQYLTDTGGITYAIHDDEFNAISQGVLGHVPGESFTVKGPGKVDHTSYVSKSEIESRGLNFDSLPIGTVLEMSEEYVDEYGVKGVALLNAVIISKTKDGVTIQYGSDNIDVTFIGYYSETT